MSILLSPPNASPFKEKSLNYKYISVETWERKLSVASDSHPVAPKLFPIVHSWEEKSKGLSRWIHFAAPILPATLPFKISLFPVQVLSSIPTAALNISGSTNWMPLDCWCFWHYSVPERQESFPSTPISRKRLTVYQLVGLDTKSTLVTLFRRSRNSEVVALKQQISQF